MSKYRLFKHNELLMSLRCPVDNPSTSWATGCKLYLKVTVHNMQLSCVWSISVIIFCYFYLQLSRLLDDILYVRTEKITQRGPNCNGYQQISEILREDWKGLSFRECSSVKFIFQLWHITLVYLELTLV